LFAARLKVDPLMEEASASMAAMTDAQTLAVAKVSVRRGCTQDLCIGHFTDEAEVCSSAGGVITFPFLVSHAHGECNLVLARWVRFKGFASVCDLVNLFVTGSS
jgi:hypothetical protein